MKEKTDTAIPSVPGPVPETRMTEQYVRDIARMAYLWAWPMVNLHNRHVAFERVPEAGLMGGVMPCGPLNQIGVLHDCSRPLGPLEARRDRVRRLTWATL